MEPSPSDFALDCLNALSPPEAEAEFLKCCGSKNWARCMVGHRPFANFDDLLIKSDRIWWSLEQADWLEAFRSHPRIGETKANQATSAVARAWSEQEQAGVKSAGHDTMQTLAAANSEYERRFGYIFIVCASGKSSEEMLAILQARLNNDPDSELRVAAEEQRKITRLRLNKLVDSLELGV
jgi:OHCU decarboxylase